MKVLEKSGVKFIIKYIQIDNSSFKNKKIKFKSSRVNTDILIKHINN
jgi:hypothetical protein